MLPSNYLQLPIDLSGSMAKNRFRWEMLWGIYRIFDLYNTTEDFVVIFDCVCDVEIFTDSNDFYYQIKSKKETKAYTAGALCKTEKAQDESTLPSILGKLYRIKATSDPHRSVCVAVVANVGFSHQKKEYTDLLEQPLVEIDDTAKEYIIKALTAEFAGQEINLENIYFIRTFMDLANPQESVIGKMVTWFVDNKGCEIKNPKALFLTITDVVKEKASYEWRSSDLTEIEKKKGLTKRQFDQIVVLHTQNAADGIALSKQWIKDNYSDFIERIDALRDLSSIVQYLPTDERLRPIIDTMKDALNEKQIPRGYDTFQTIDFLQSLVQKQVPNDYSENQIRMLALITIKQLEEIVCQF
ncbi:MAG: dsDNA nuclease domain-containing protein [Candidatus Limiplasma sp.]|nr:dsDNA nuclease domain-containing protein [Candidatus Limiplasma sp.]